MTNFNLTGSRSARGMADLGDLFGDPQNAHGGPDEPVTYAWPADADAVLRASAAAALAAAAPPAPAPPLPPPVRLRIPAPEEWDLMAHFVWESSMKMADLIARGADVPVRARTVLEVGAGAGLPSVVSAHAGARLVVSTDYPEESVIDALRDNVDANTASVAAPTRALGHSWGTDVTPLLRLLRLAAGNAADNPRQADGFDVVLAADCLWLHDQHTNLLNTLSRCLAADGTAYFTYQHHNEHAPSFFEQAARAYGFSVAHVGAYGWAGREVEDFDSEDEETMGPIYLSSLTWQTTTTAAASAKKAAAMAVAAASGPPTPAPTSHADKAAEAAAAAPPSSSSSSSSATTATATDDRTFPAPGRGGLGMDPRKTCLLCIEFQNEFATPGGKLHGKVKANMESTGMLEKTSALAAELRALGVKVFHAPISFAADGSDNPNKHLGILAGCDYNQLFVRGTWNAAICDSLAPQPGDVVVVGKRGLSAFPNTTLEAELRAHGVETIALAGFMANCCVESTMREACEKGFNVVTLTDCVATTSLRGWKAATEITYPFFSVPMRKDTFLANVQASVSASSSSSSSSPSSSPAVPSAPHPRPSWAVRRVVDNGDDVFQFGPWFVDVRLSTVGEKLTLRSGAHELRRYLTFAEASGMFAAGGGCGCCCALGDTEYAKRLPAYAEKEAQRAARGPADPGVETEPFGWLCNMTVLRLPAAQGGGCVLYSPILDEDNRVDGVLRELEARDLLPVRIVLAPSPQHHLALTAYQEAVPDAVFLCGRASPQMPPLTKKRRDLRFDAEVCAHGGQAVLRAPSYIGGAAVVAAAAAAAVAARGAVAPAVQAAWAQLLSVCDVSVLDDRRTGEVVLLHRPSRTLVVSDLLYKSNPAVVGPGGGENHYSLPEWFAEGQQELFYGKPGDNSGGLLPAYRTHPRMRTIDLDGMRRSLDGLLGWGFARALACHTDPMGGDEARGLIRRAWGWVWRELGVAAAGGGAGGGE